MKKTYRFLALLLAFLFLPLPLYAHSENESGIVRVLLTRLNLTNRVEIALDGSYTLNQLSFQRGSHLTVSCASGTLMVYYEGMAFDAGKQLTLLRHAVSDGKENGFRINGAYELHPGDLYLTIHNGQIRPILFAPVEEYLLGVVPYEMSDSFPLEALKAQAIAARTYALRKISGTGDYDVVDNTNDQAYYGVKAENARAAQAVKDTAGLCGYYKNHLAQCYYSASNGGQTELAAHVWGTGSDDGYLAMVDDPYDLENKNSTVLSYAIPKVLSNTKSLGKIEPLLRDALSEPAEARGYDPDQIRIISIDAAQVCNPKYQDSPSKIMTKLQLTVIVQGKKTVQEEEEEEISIFAIPVSPAPAAEKKVEREDAFTVQLDIFPTLEAALSLSINSGSNEIFSVRETADSFILESRRYGHGVGMSQRGAECMAGNHQWTCDQILRFYYPGMTVKKVNFSFSMPAALQSFFLATPGPAATPTPRPTAIPLSITPAPGEYTVSVTNIGVNSYLNLRAEANTQSAVLQQLYYGQKLIVTKDLGEWLQVKTDTLTGYVMKEFVEKH